MEMERLHHPDNRHPFPYTASVKKFLAGIVVGLALVPMGMQAAITLFRDVNPDDWYGPAVSRLQEHGIVNGYQDGTFQPHREVSRAELAVIIDRVLHTVDPEYAAQSGENLMEITLFFTDRDVAIEKNFCSLHGTEWALNLCTITGRMENSSLPAKSKPSLNILLLATLTCKALAGS